MTFLDFKNPSDHPFSYDLHPCFLPGENKRVMVCFHGYGNNYTMAESLKSLRLIEAMLITFNFPDYDIKPGSDPKKATFGTMDELLPALYVLKQAVVDQGFNSIDLYGFSSGGAALINAIGVLNTSIHDASLKKIGIQVAEKEDPVPYKKGS